MSADREPLPPSAFDAASTLTTALRVIQKYWGTIVACVIFCSGAAIAYTKSSPKVYQAQAMLELNPHAAQPLGDKEGGGLDIGAGVYWDTREYYETEYKILTSDRVLRAVVRDLGLANDTAFLGMPPGSSPTASEDAAVDTLRGHITVEPVKNSRLLLVVIEDLDPKRAARLSDAVSNAFIDQNLQEAISATSDAVTWLNGQVDHIKQDLDKNENALHKFKQENDLPSTSINEASNMLRLEMQDLNTALTQTRMKKEELSARNAELSKVAADNPDQLAASELLASPYLQNIRGQYQEAVKERDTLTASGKLENHPLVREATQRVNDTRKTLLGEVKNIQGAIERDLAIVARQEEGEARLFEAARRQAVDLNMKEIEYHRLDRSRDQNEKLFSLLLGRMKEADVARMMKVNNIRIVDTAAVPKGPVRPRPLVNLCVGLLSGLLLGIALSWGREQMDRSLKTPEDVEEKLGVTFLGLLPSFEEDKDRVAANKGRTSRRHRSPSSKMPPELVVHETPLSGIAEAARSIRTNLMFMNPDNPYKRLLVSSAAPAEGKTTVACSIAIALAQGGQRVCIVDCDLRRPRLHRIFGRTGDAGVTNVIVGESTLDEVAKPTMVQNLWSVPAGPTPPNPADLLHSDRFKKFMNDLSERFDRVVIDSPPVVPVTDSAIISTLVDGTVFVVRAFATSRHMSRQGLRTLRDVDSPVVGVVLNAVNLSRREYSYSYQYYYHREGYGYATRPETKEEEEEDTSSMRPPPAPPN
jgi:capsular exopolysaccharide synthesis family protein